MPISRSCLPGGGEEGRVKKTELFFKKYFHTFAESRHKTIIKTNLARSTSPRLQPCLWSRREISLRTKSRVYRAMVRPTLLYGCETWPVPEADERMLGV